MRFSWPAATGHRARAKARSASRAGRPIVVPFGFCGTTVFRMFQEVTVAEGLFGERGGTRTLDPMIKSHVLTARNKAACNQRTSASDALAKLEWAEVKNEPRLTARTIKKEVAPERSSKFNGLPTRPTRSGRRGRRLVAVTSVVLRSPFFKAAREGRNLSKISFPQLPLARS